MNYTIIAIHAHVKHQHSLNNSPTNNDRVHMPSLNENLESIPCKIIYFVFQSRGCLRFQYEPMTKANWLKMWSLSQWKVREDWDILGSSKQTSPNDPQLTAIWPYTNCTRQKRHDTCWSIYEIWFSFSFYNPYSWRTRMYLHAIRFQCRKWCQLSPYTNLHLRKKNNKKRIWDNIFPCLENCNQIKKYN